MRNPYPLVSLSNVLHSVSRPLKVQPNEEYRLLGIRLDGGGIFHRETKLGTQTSATTLYYVEPNDFIYSRLFAWRGAFGIVQDEFDGAVVSNEFPIFQPDVNLIDLRYLLFWFRLFPTLAKVEAVSSGSTPLTRNRFKETAFLEMQIPLPPLTEQQRIVARIEALAGKIEEAKRLRASTVEEAKASERMMLDDHWRRLAAKHGVRQLQDVCVLITDGDHNTPAFTDSGVRFIFVGNVSSGQLHFSGSKFVDPVYYTALSSPRKPVKGDILYSAVGATLGVPAIVNVDIPFCFQRHIALIRPNSEQVLPQYLWYMLRSGIVYRSAWEGTTGSAQPTVPLRAIRRLALPIPSIEDQRQCLNHLDGLKSKMDAIKCLQNESTKELNALLPAVLDRAFRGEL